MATVRLLFAFFLTCSVISSLLNCCTASKIVLMPTLGNSHYYIFRRIAEELGGRGHQVILLLGSQQRYEPSDKFETLTFKAFMSTLSTKDTLLNEIKQTANPPFFKIFKLGASVTYMQQMQCESLFNDTNKAVLEKLRGLDIDVLVGDGIDMCPVLLSDHLDILRVDFVTAALLTPFTTAYDVPSPVSYVPAIGTGLADKMNFWERLKNTVASFIFNLLWKQIHFSRFDAIKIKHNIKPERSYTESRKNAELVLYMNDFALDIPQPLNPGMVLVGPLLPRPPAPLSEDLERFMSSSREAGVVLVSFGSMMSSPPPEIIHKLAKALGRLKQKVLWKIDAKAASSLSSNIRAMDWFPQNDLLGHPQTRAFVSHVGLNSLQEAAYHGVPVVGIPFWGDQPSNAVRMARSGMGLWVQLYSITSDELYATVVKVVENPSFKANATRISRLLKDRRRTPLQETADWIEYVLRHGGAKHLRPEVFNITWYQYYLLDVALFLAAILAAVIKVVQTVCCCVCGMCKAKKKNKTD